MGLGINKYHDELNLIDGIHVSYSFEYVDANTRNSATGFIAADVGKFARQLNDNTIWMLTSLTPTWVCISSQGDVLVGVSSNDTTPSYLQNKITSTANKISLSVTNEGGDEKLNFSIGSNVFDKSIDTLDAISDGTTYNKVKAISLTTNEVDHTKILNRGTNTHSQIDSHISSVSNPHSVTATQVGLGNFEASTTNIKMNGSVSVGSLSTVPRSDHVHPIDTSREPVIGAGTISQYWRGDKTWQTLNSTVVGLGNVTNDAQLKRSANDFTTFSEKLSPIGSDVLLIEDAANAYNKKRILISSLSSTSDDHKVLNSVNDTTPSYLSNKLIGTTNKITLTTNNAGGNETLQITIGSNVFDKSIDTLDAISDGPIYGKTKSSSLTIGEVDHTKVLNRGTNTHSQIDSHISSISNPHSVTATQVGLGNVTNDAQLKRAANDFTSFPAKSIPTNSDVFLIEDSANSYNKKKSTLSEIFTAGQPFGTSFYHLEDEAETATSSGTYVNKLTFTVNNIVSGQYRIEWYYEQNNSSANKVSDIRIYYVTGATLMGNTMFSNNAITAWVGQSGHVIIDLIDGTHSWTIDIRSPDGGSVKIRRARILLWRLM